jgi:hypothetical protein
MTASMLRNEREQTVDLSFDPTSKLEWVVREDPELQAELNGIKGSGKDLSPKLVNKVLDRIKDL